MENFVWLGTELKYLVEITAHGFSMADDNFFIDLIRGGVTRRFEKSDLITDGENYYLAFDTTDFGAGELYATITAYVPDNDFPDHLRTEVWKVKLTTIKS